MLLASGDFPGGKTAGGTTGAGAGITTGGGVASSLLSFVDDMASDACDSTICTISFDLDSMGDCVTLPFEGDPGSMSYTSNWRRNQLLLTV